MSAASSPMLLVGVGTAGSRIAHGVSRAFGGDLRLLAVDTDAASGQDEENFLLIGGNRLSGRGAGGDVVAARLAAEDSISALDGKLEGVRLAVVVTALGGGTGGGATIEILKRLTDLGIHSIVFATTPFAFEGEDRMRNARGVMSMVEEAASAAFFLPLDKLVGGEDNMEAAMKRAVDTIAGGVTLFWRLVEKPGYIRLDADRIRRLVANAGRGRFAFVTVQGPDRASEAVDRLVRSEMLAIASAPVNAILCGVLAGEDLRLSELGRVADGIREAFGEQIPFEIGTVNDEATFCGRLSVVVMLFESAAAVETPQPGQAGARRRGAAKSPLGPGQGSARRFHKTEPTIWHGEDLDLPTYLRRNINLDL